MNFSVSLRCLICLEESPDLEFSKLYEKGIESLIQVSSDDLITLPFADAALKETVSHVHKKCRVNFLTNHKRTSVLMDDGPEIVAKKLRSSSEFFNWKMHCFICGSHAVIDDRHPNRNSVYLVRTIDSMIEKLRNVSQHQLKSAIDIRLSEGDDLVALEARYHHSCMKDYLNDRNS